MKRSLPALTLFACAAVYAEDGTFKYYGYAYDLDTRQFLYTEVDEMREVGGRTVGGTTRYFGKDGREFGHKTLDFAAGGLVPIYRLEVSAPAYVEAITGVDAEIAMLRQSSGKTETGTVKKNGLMVADEGLAELLSDHLDELVKGATLKFRVIAPSELDNYKFRAARIADTVFENRPALQIQADMDSMLKLFAGPLVFVFDSATHKLLEYRGPSDLPNPSGARTWPVRLSYPSVRPKDAPALPP